MSASWRIELLGGLRAARGDRVITHFRTQKNALLLAYLALYPQHPQPREALVELLWPETDPEAGRNNLRFVLSSLRRELEPSEITPGTVLIADRQTVRLNPAAFSTDVAGFREAVEATARMADSPRRNLLLTAAVALYRGELLPGFFEPWVLTEREQMVELYLEALQQLIAALEQTGDLDNALEYARRAVVVDPLREEAHYDLMRLYATAGQPSATLHQYQELERLLREELGETPSAATRALAEELRESARTVVVARALVERREPNGGREAANGNPAEADLGPSPVAVPPPSVSPLLAPPLPPTRLPTQFTRFFGREEEIARLMETLRVPETRLVTLTGPGGSGKTRLAIAVAGRLQEEFRGASLPQSGGPWFVPLAEAREARHLGEALREALGLLPSPDAEPLEQVVAALQNRPALLVLDNFEQLVDEGAPVVRSLLARLPALTCLVTSRRRLELAGEQEFVVLPLPTPGIQVFRYSGVQDRLSANPEHLNTRTPEYLNTLLHYPSVQLFLDRAQAARPGFQLTAENAAAVAALCDRLEGLPLAIELAAARAGVLTPQQMLPRLQQRFELLVSRQRDLSARHRSLRAALDWSYQLLSPELQQCFARLSVFSGGWTLQAAEAVCGDGCRASGVGCRPDSDPTPVLERLEQLRECSLVVVEETPGAAEMRYRLLETLRVYGSEQLTPEQQTKLRRAHARYFLRLAKQAEAEWVSHQEAWLQRLEQEHDNLRAALDWAAATGSAAAEQSEEDRELGLALGAALGWFWQVRGYLTEGRERLAAVLQIAPPGASDRARALGYAGRLAILQGDVEAGSRLVEESLALARAREDKPIIAGSLRDLAGLRRHSQTARPLYEEARAIYQELNDPPSMAGVLVSLGSTYSHADPAREGALYQQALEIFRQIEDKRGIAWTLVYMGNYAHYLGDFPAARSHAEECLALFRELGDRMGIGCALGQLGAAAVPQGRFEEARSLYQQGLQIARELESKQDIVACLNRLGEVALREGDLGEAGTLYEESCSLARTAGVRWGHVRALLGLGQVNERRGQTEEAIALYAEGLRLARDAEERLRSLWCLEALVRTRSRVGTLPPAEQRAGDSDEAAAPISTLRPAQAALLLGAAQALQDAIRSTRPPHEQAEHDAALVALRQTLGEADFALAWEAGRALPWDEAVAMALGER